MGDIAFDIGGHMTTAKYLDFWSPLPSPPTCHALKLAEYVPAFWGIPLSANILCACPLLVAFFPLALIITVPAFSQTPTHCVRAGVAAVVVVVDGH